VGTVRRRSKCPILIQLRSQFESGMTVGMELKINSKLKRGSASSIACSNSRPFGKRIASSAQIDAAYKMNEAFCTLGITDLLHQTAMFEEYLLRLAMLFWKHVDKENRPMPVVSGRAIFAMPVTIGCVWQLITSGKVISGRTCMTAALRRWAACY
jgi:hypothetical protein